MNRFHRWYCRSDRWAKVVHGTVMPWVLGDLEPGDDVLEVGPRPGSPRTTFDAGRLVRPRSKTPTPQHRVCARPAATSMWSRVTQTRTPFDDNRFSTAVSFTMLHHVPSPQLQDKLLAEVCRVLRPGGIFTGATAP